MQATINAAAVAPELADFADQLGEAMTLTEDTIKAVDSAPDPSLALANATIFLDAMGHMVIAWMWLKQGVAALQGQRRGDASDQAFYAGKLSAMRFFYKYELPKTRASMALVADLDNTCYVLTAEQFTGT
jgi:butyryl-CoA dehydrogenase